MAQTFLLSQVRPHPKYTECRHLIVEGVTGDFEEIYGHGGNNHEQHTGQWDAVLTCFFIDTVCNPFPATFCLLQLKVLTLSTRADPQAKNVVNYLRIIHDILAPGGVWINLGPLLWHWENNTSNDPSVELTLEEVKLLARKIGFEVSVSPLPLARFAT